MSEEEKNVYTNLFQYSTQKIVKLELENIELKSKITKVIEYLENNNLYNKDDLFINMILLNILKGEN